MVGGVGEWGAASFENDAASEWFLLVEEAVDPGGVIASSLDSAVGESEYLGLDESCAAIAAAELSASCAGHASVRLPDNVRYWVDTHPHQPHDSEIDQALQAVQRVREESELRDYWDRSGDREKWLREVEDLITLLAPSGALDAIRRSEELQVLDDFHVIVNAEKVRHVPDQATNLFRAVVDRMAADRGLAPGWVEQGGKDAHRGRLAGAVRADEPIHIALR